MRNIIISLLGVYMLVGACLPTLAQEKKLKKRVAVFVFDDKTDRSWRWWNNKGVGEGMSDMLTTELVKSGNYRVIERTQLEAVVLKEQALGASGVVSEQSAAKVGKVLGVEIAIVGAVTEFGYKDDSKDARIKGLGVGVKNQSAAVAVDVRFINTTTGEIIMAENVRRTKSSKGLKFNTRQMSFNDRRKFDESLVGKAAREAIEDITRIIERQAPNIPWAGKVVTEKGGVVFINVGSADGLSAGDKFVVYRAGEELIDPDTGISLGSTETKIGEIQVSNPNVGNGKASQCTIVSGSGFTRGDIVKEN